MKRFYFLFLLTCLAFSCEKQEYSNIPWSPVNLTLHLNAEDKILNGLLSYKTYTQKRTETDRLGYGGILVVNGYGNGILNLLAYDMSCPVEARSDIKIVPNDEGQAKCPECGAVYNIATSGTPISGSKFSLIQYKVYPASSGNDFKVTN